MRISDWSSDVCSSDLGWTRCRPDVSQWKRASCRRSGWRKSSRRWAAICTAAGRRSEEHTSELQSLMRISYAVFCLKKKKKTQKIQKISAHNTSNNKRTYRDTNDTHLRTQHK